MAEIYTLREKCGSSPSLEAEFDPANGMALKQLKYGNHELLETNAISSLAISNEGAGTIIGPHFGVRNPRILPILNHPEQWNHLQALRGQGVEDPFPHGVARYVAWQAESNPEELKALLDGKQEAKGQELEQLEGQQFKMTSTARIDGTETQMAANVVSHADSIIGYSFAFRLPGGKGRLVSDVADYYLEGTAKRPLPADCHYDENHCIHLDLSQPADYTFHPYLNPTRGELNLETKECRLKLNYRCVSQENAWQIVRPKEGSYVVIRCLSAKYPSRPTLSVSGLQVSLQVEINA